MFAFAHSFLLLLVLSVSANPLSVKRETNGSRLARGLPPLKPTRRFNPSRTNVRRDEPSGIPMSTTGTFQIVPVDPSRRRAFEITYLFHDYLKAGGLAPTTDRSRASSVKLPRGAPFTDGTIRVTRGTEFSNLVYYRFNPSDSGYDVCYLATNSSPPGSPFSLTSSRLLTTTYIPEPEEQDPWSSNPQPAEPTDPMEFAFTPKWFSCDIFQDKLIIGARVKEDLAYSWALVNCFEVKISFVPDEI